MKRRTIHRLIVVILFAGLMLAICNTAGAQVFKDPLLECSYHEKYDLTWVQGFFDQMMSSAKDESLKAVYKSNYDIVKKMGLFDLVDVTMDCRLDGDRFVGAAKFTMDMKSPGDSIIRDVISVPPRASVVRALIPEEETIAWFSVSDPDVVFDAIKEIKEITKTSDCCPEVMNVLGQVQDYMGDEAHIIFYDLVNTDKNLDPQPRYDFAFVANMKEGITDNELESLRELAKSIIVDKFGGKVTESEWNGYKVQSFADFGCPLDINPCLIVDKYFMIFATYPESLEKTASYVLTPQRTAQSNMPVIMNAMVTVNFDRLMKKELPEDFVTGFASLFVGGDFGSLINQIKEESWGNLRVVRTHLKDGVLVEYSMDKSLYSFLCTLIRESLIYAVNDIMPTQMPAEVESVPPPAAAPSS